jgi:hypothetical protein
MVTGLSLVPWWEMLINVNSDVQFNIDVLNGGAL